MKFPLLRGLDLEGIILTLTGMIPQATNYECIGPLKSLFFCLQKTILKYFHIREFESGLSSVTDWIYIR